MSLDRRQILDHAMRLPEPERRELLYQLMATFEDGLDPELEAEVARRSQELDSGQAQGVPWETVREEMWGIIRGRGKLDHHHPS